MRTLVFHSRAHPHPSAFLYALPSSLVALALSHPSSAQERALAGASPIVEEEPEATAATSAGEERLDEVLVRPFLQIMNAEAGLQPEAGGAELLFEPNPTENVGVKLGAFGFAVSLSIGIGHSEAVHAFGKSTNFNLEFSYPFEVFSGRELFLTAFVHYHDTLSATGDIGERRIIDDAKIATAGFDAVLVLDPDFSVDAVLGDFRRREGSDGSWFLRSSMGIWHLGFWRQPNRFLVPAERIDDLGNIARVNHIQSAFGTFGAGYVYDWNMFHHFFLTAMGNLGLDVAALELTYAFGDREILPAVGPSVALQIGLSYVGENFHTGLTANATADFTTARGVDIIGQRVSALLFAGVRF